MIKRVNMNQMRAVIAGGTSGIGLEIAKHLMGQGCQVIVSGRNADKLGRALKELGDGAVGFLADLSTVAGQKEWLSQCDRELAGQPLDFLVHCAAVYYAKPLAEEDSESIQAAFQTNVVSAMVLAQGLYPKLKQGRGKSALFISSTLSLKPIPGSGTYSASKAALDSVVSSLALEWASEGIRVNSIQPGVIDTPIHDPRNPGEPSRHEKMTQMGPFHPLGRVGRVEEVARAAVFLLAPESNWITGVKWPVDGGISLV